MKNEFEKISIENPGTYFVVPEGVISRISAAPKPKISDFLTVPEDMKAFEYIRIFRLCNRQTIEELATSLGTEKQHLQKIETGKVPLTPKIIEKLGDLWGPIFLEGIKFSSEMKVQGELRRGET